MYGKSNTDIDELICRSLRGRTSEAEEARLRSWRQAAARNEAHFREMVGLLEAAESAVRGTAPPPPPPLAKLIPRRERGVAPPHAGARGRRWAWGGGLAAVAAVLAALLLGLPRPASEPRPERAFSFGAGEFVTGPEETATVVLSDGTVVRLAPHSRLRIPGVSGSREVFLDGGAFFAVAKMAGYPFQVRTQAGEAVVLGTRFEVRARGDDLRLVVLEGRVALGSGGQRVEVTAGEVSRISHGTTTTPVKVPDVRPLVPWLNRFIVFQSTPLREAAEELERAYGVRVEVTDSALAEQTITGWYADRSFAEVFAVVCEVLQAECSVQDGVARIEP